MLGFSIAYFVLSLSQTKSTIFSIIISTLSPFAIARGSEALFLEGQLQDGSENHQIVLISFAMLLVDNLCYLLMVLFYEKILPDGVNLTESLHIILQSNGWFKKWHPPPSSDTQEFPSDADVEEVSENIRRKDVI